jgi:hypothetical protein
MSLSRRDLIKKLNEASSELLREKGYISFVDVLMKIGKLAQEDYEGWRFRRIPYLEKVITVNLAKMNHLLRTLHANAKRGGLKASRTAYMSWGKGPKTRLQFSKTGDPNIEAAYATHFLRPTGLQQPMPHTDPHKGRNNDLNK